MRVPHDSLPERDSLANSDPNMSANSVEVDPNSKDLAYHIRIHLILEDLGGLLVNDDSKTASSDQSDQKAALEAYKEEIARAIAYNEDRLLAGELALIIAPEEAQAVLDRHEALRLSGRTSWVPLNQAVADNLERVNGTGAHETSDANLAAITSPLRQTEEIHYDETEAECYVCSDVRLLSSCLKGPCGHAYCKECTLDLFTCATKDETLFPPRCCQQPFSVQDASRLLPDEVFSSFNEKSVEFSTPSKDRVWCSKESCSTFITLEFISGNEGTCPKCFDKTCIICKDGAHDGHCPEHPEVKAILAKAAEEGWKQCFKCKSLVELTYGCNHMTCRCKAEFCYECGVEWKTPKACDCPVWNEVRLYANARARAARGLRRNVRVDDAVVEQERERLRNRHDCNHGFEFHHGADRCEVCTENMPVFTMECGACGMRVCRRCHDNRL